MLTVSISSPDNAAIVTNKGVEMNLTKLIAEQTAKPDVMLFKIQDQPAVLVESVEDAARKWAAYRDKTYGGVSEIGNGGVVFSTKNGRGCHVVAKISYNGRISH